MLSGFADKVVLHFKINPWSTDDFIHIEEMIKEYMLLTSMMEEWSISSIFVTYHHNAVQPIKKWKYVTIVILANEVK